MFGKFGKSILKGAKYAGLSLGVAALSGVNDAVPGFILDVLLKSGAPETIALVVSGYGTPFLAAWALIALQQAIHHRDKIFGGE